MESENALTNPQSSLSHQMRVVVARERGVGAAELRWIGTDPDLFEAIYRDHVEEA